MCVADWKHMAAVAASRARIPASRQILYIKKNLGQRADPRGTKKGSFKFNRFPFIVIRSWKLPLILIS